jgi:SIR2-like domain
MGTIPLIAFDPSTQTQPYFPAPSENGGSRIQALLVGAGISMAVHSGALSWGELICALAKGLGGKQPATEHWYVEGLRLSREYSPRKRDAVPTRFQEKVKHVIQNSISRPASDADWVDLSKALREFLAAIKCTVILDTNYDSTMEWLLEDAGIRYTRLIGSEATSVSPLPGDAVILWKVHGTVDAPSTIVLSPTEYQRIYESNALGDVMQSLGQRIDCLWVMGCGLGDDETWTYLCTDDGPKQIACLWQTTHEAIPLSAPADWVGQVGTNHRDVRVYWAQVLKTPDYLSGGRRRTANQLTHITKTIVGSIPEGRKSSQREWWEHRIDAFDHDYQAILGTKNIPAALAIVAGARADFESLKNYLLSQQKDTMGKTWCAGVPTDLTLNDDRKRSLAEDFARVVEVAIALCKEWKDSILVAAAAQAAVGYVVELAEILGIPVTVELKQEPQRLALAPNQKVLVGANPFFVRADQAYRANLMHFHRTRTGLDIQYPLAALEASVHDGTTLMEENDWEARVIHAYGRRSPCLLLNGEVEIQINSLPPLYPWGFRLGDIKAFRDRMDFGTISQCWHLVSNVEGGWQICKGGGLRDRGRIAFRIGNRGRVRIGEYDAFVQPAYS